MNKIDSALGRLRFRSKLVLLLVAPALAAAFFAITVIMDNSRVASDLGKMEELSGLAVEISALVHETQKERGNTGLFVGAAGNEFGDNLSNQRSQTDKQVAQLEDFLGGFDAGLFGTEFQRDLNELNSGINGLSGHRTNVSSLSLSVGESLAYYTELNATALGLVASMAELSPNSELTALTAAYVNFLQAKERAGIERAVLSSAFARGKFNEGEFAKFNSLVTAQNTYLAVFETMATSEIVDFYDRTLTGSAISNV